VAHLAKKITAALGAALTAVALAVVPTGNASAATNKPHIDTVPCGPPDYLQVWYHEGNDVPRGETICFANAGTETFDCGPVGCWLDAFSTGANVVQYEADGRWQPDTPVGRYTYFTFPNHPGGVNLQGMKIF
jgi:hypothetical protein